MELDEAKKLIEAEQKKRCDDFSKELQVLIEKYKVDLVPCVAIGDNSYDIQQLINGQPGIRIVSK